VRACLGIASFFGHGDEEDDSLGGLKGPTARRPFGVTLQQLYDGVSINIKLERRVVCRGCRRRTKDNAERCDKCDRCPDEIANVLKQMGGFMVRASCPK
jgi:DnaJ-class molecular chaperone